MKKYAKWVYPQISTGKRHRTPIKPSCFATFEDQSVNWNIHSNDPNDRTEYWEVDLTEHARVKEILPLLTLEEVNMEIYGQTTKIAPVWPEPEDLSHETL